MNYNKPTPIVFCTDSNYFPYVATVIQSVMENANRNKSFNIYILFDPCFMNSGYLKLLKEQISLFSNFSIEFIDVSGYFKDHVFPNLNYSVTAYYRLIIPYLFTNYEQVIYLDCDIICLYDISELLEESVDNCLLNCVRDSGVINWEKEYSKELGLKNVLNYFNSGVLVFNTAKFKAHITLEELLNTASAKNWAYADQCILNTICEGKVNFLSMKWNVMSDQVLKNVSSKIKKEYIEAQFHPRIIHYVWDKPWNQFFITDRNKHFWTYARKTPFIDDILLRLKNIKLEKQGLTPTMVYEEIQNNKQLGISFIMKCAWLWVRVNLQRLMN
jgi:lipopolysaccharide biosynthesis glycosyltransferase